MTIEHHDLVHEFPEYKDQIHSLKMDNAHFKKLFEKYHKVTRSVENMEREVTPVTSAVEETAKIERLHLKDELYAMILKEVKGN